MRANWCAGVHSGLNHHSAWTAGSVMDACNYTTTCLASHLDADRQRGPAAQQRSLRLLMIGGHVPAATRPRNLSAGCQ